VFVNKKVQRLALKKCSTGTNTKIAKSIIFSKERQVLHFRCQVLYSGCRALNF
jgi:hypothetical protein